MHVPVTRSADVEVADAECAAHVVRLPGQDWGVWRWVGLRGAGFPVGNVLRLSAPACAAAADRLVQSQDQEGRAAHAAQETLRAAARLGSREDRAAVTKFAAALRAGKADEKGGAWAAHPDVVAYRAAAARLDAATGDYVDAFRVARDAQSAAIRDVAASGAFREAIVWQNRQAFHTAVEALLRKPAGAVNKKVRQHEELVARYLQRYCTKNETIGFFGPVGWARFVPTGPRMNARPGAELVSQRSVYFEGWAIDALAEAIAADPRTRRWLTPRQSPCVRASHSSLLLPVGGALALTTNDLAVWSACDGTRTAEEIARALASQPLSGFTSEPDVYAALERLREKDAISWTIDIPVQPHPERTLRAVIERFADAEVREPALQKLADLEAGREQVSIARGSDAVDAAMSALEGTFTRATGVLPTRAAGKTYAARTLVYQDCQRDLKVDLGPAVLDELGPPLALLLASARWFTYTVADTYRSALTEIYSTLAFEAGDAVVDGVKFWTRAQTVLFGTQDRPVDRVLSDFQRRWAAILELPPEVRSVQLASSNLRGRVDTSFGVPGPGWGGARYHSPDIMVSARDVAAIQRGEYELVLGELHMAMNSLSSTFFLEQHPAREELFRALESDLPRGRVLPVVPKYWPKRTVRTDPALVSPRDVRLEFAPGARADGRLPVLRLGSLVVASSPAGVVVRTADGRLAFDLIDFFGEIFTGMLADRFKILSPDPHTPRVRIDRLVICRETWRVPARESSFAWEPDEARRFAGSRRWARALGLPRFLFVKTPTETKPFYVDLASPGYVDVLSRMIRRCDEEHRDPVVVFSEMLPAPVDAWLPDREGARYTSELRIVAVDFGSPE